MGNACGCADDRKTGESVGKIGENNSAYAVQFKQPGYQSKISPAFFAQYSEADKNAMLAEALQILTTSVESSKHASNNMVLNQFLIKTTGKATNAHGDEYEGEFINGVANGKGRIREKNGNLYEGTMLNGLRHGEGKITEAKPDGFNGRVTYLHDVAVGKTVLNANTKSNFSKTSEGGFDKDGNYSGPYLNISHDGDLAYELLSNNLREGPFVVIAHDKTSIAMAEFKADKEVKPMAFYVPGPTVQAPAQGKAPAPAQGQAPAPAQGQAPAPAQAQGTSQSGAVGAKQQTTTAVAPSNPQTNKA